MTNLEPAVRRRRRKVGSLQNPHPLDWDPIHSVYWCHLPDHSDDFTQGYIGITKHTKRREREWRKTGRFESGFLFTVLAENLTRFEAAKMEWERRKQRLIGWNHKAGGGKYIRAMADAIEPGLLTTEYHFADKVACFSYAAGTTVDAPALKAYCRDLVGGPCEIEVFVGDQRIDLD